MLIGHHMINMYRSLFLCLRLYANVVARSIMCSGVPCSWVCLCVSLHASVRLEHDIGKCWTYRYFHPNFQHGAFWNKDERVKFWDQSSTSRCGPTCWKMHFLSLLMRYLKVTGLNFTKLSALLHFWDKDEVPRQFLGLKGQRSGSQHDQGHSGWRHIQTTELDAVRRV